MSHCALNSLEGLIDSHIVMCQEDATAAKIAKTFYPPKMSNKNLNSSSNI